MTRVTRMIAGVLAVVVTLAACTAATEESQTAAPTTAESPSPAQEPSPTREPYAPAAQPSPVDTADVRMPLALEDADVVDPSWTAPPLELDGIVLGPVERDGLVEFTAIRVDGEALWTVQRALGADVALTRTSQGDPLAVITDEVADSSTTTATAYHLGTGDLAWGPIEVPGHLTGPGIVFSPSPGAQGDDAGAAVALHPDTGSPLTWGGAEDERTLGESDGQALVETQGRVELRDAHDGTVRWAVNDPTWAGTVTVATDSELRDGLLILEDGAGTRALVRMDTGQVIAEGILDAVIDPTTSTVVVTSADGMRAIDLDGVALWAIPTADKPVLHAARGALVYTRDGTTMRVHNIVTGAVALAYEDGGSVIAVPERFFTTGAAIITVDGRLLLATSPY
ncbi:hypothetical protein [Demequina sp.]|uniref:hypothetical protein n=1 Tax=Demequina sp. TaxID=2050685 RepID=UPI0025C215BC|nr:hypothetical protein [Demequina sp.]